jgi:peptidyl-prolyl cis-trans isomerase SurA
MKISLFRAAIIFFTFFSILLSTSAQSKKDAVLDRVVAIVNNEAIPESALDRQMQLIMVRIKQGNMNAPPEDQLRKQLLDRMILEKLQLQKAKEVSVIVEEAELNSAISDIAKRDQLTLLDLKKSVEGQGIPFSQFRDTIKTELTILKLQHRELGQTITVSNAEIEQFLKSPGAQDQNNTEYHLAHILIPLPEMHTERMDLHAKKEAAEIIQKLNQGADFSELAIAKSSASNALQGGDLGWRKTPELPTLFAKIVPSLSVGTIHGPIRNDSGYHIIKLIDKRIDGIQAINSETFRNKAKDILTQRKMDERLGVWLRRLRDDSEVVINLN